MPMTLALSLVASASYCQHDFEGNKIEWQWFCWMLAVESFGSWKRQLSSTPFSSSSVDRIKSRQDIIGRRYLWKMVVFKGVCLVKDKFSYRCLMVSEKIVGQCSSTWISRLGKPENRNYVYLPRVRISLRVLELTGKCNALTSSITPVKFVDTVLVSRSGRSCTSATRWGRDVTSLKVLRQSKSEVKGQWTRIDQQFQQASVSRVNLEENLV